MSVEVDDLFSGGESAPPPDPSVRIARIARVGRVGHLVGLIGGAAAVALSLVSGGGESGAPPDPWLGYGWFAAVALYLLLVPSVLVSLYAWHRAGEELDRVRLGALPRAYAPALRVLKRSLLTWLGVAGVGMLLQGAVLSVLMASAPPA